MKDDFMTYKEFEEFIDSIDRFTYEYASNNLHVFYDYGENKINGNLIPVRQPLFTIDLVAAFSIIAPYGFRLTQAKRMKNFNEVEEKALALSRTPIYKRGG